MEEREGNTGERKGLGNKKVQRKEKVANHFKRDLVARYTYNINTVLLKIDSILSCFSFLIQIFEFPRIFQLNLYEFCRNREII